MGSVQALREDYNNRQNRMKAKRSAAVQSIFTGSAVLFMLTMLYLWVRVYVQYGFWVPTLIVVASVMALVYVSARED